MSKRAPSAPNSKASTKKPVRMLIAIRRSAWTGVIVKVRARKGLGAAGWVVGTAGSAASGAGGAASGDGGPSAGICSHRYGSLLKLGLDMYLMRVRDGDPFAVEGKLHSLVDIRADLYEVGGRNPGPQAQLHT